jgi:glycine/D-amino acid oxidase-like deaminating enzyme
LIGTMGRVIGNKDRGLTRRWAEKSIRAIFPELGRVTFEEAWHGQIAMTPDHLPRVHQLAPGLWTAIGYNGRGITTGTLFGASIADLLTGMDPAELPLPLTKMSRAPRAAWTSRFYDLAFTANQIRKGLI